MTLEESNNFYKQDKKEYILTNKKIINNWLKDIIEIESIDLKNIKYPENYGYVLKETIKNIIESIKDIKNLQSLIDFIANWYEIKYPDYYFEYSNNKQIRKNMNIHELINKLNRYQKDVIICGYRAGGWSSTPNIVNNKKISESSIFFCIEVITNIGGLNKNYFITINSDYKSGLVDLTGIEGKELINIIEDKYIMRGYINLDDLYNELMKCDNVECNSLKATILDRNMMLKIRKHILELVSLKLLYSKNTIPEYGYERAKTFIKEFNNSLNTNLNTNKIDEIMNTNYVIVKKLHKN